MRRRSRSRSPIRREFTSSRRTSSSVTAVNMLDPTVIESSRSAGGGERKKITERITCTIPGNARGRGRVADRLSGGSYSDRRVISVRGEGNSRFDSGSRTRGGDIHSRLTRSADRPKGKMDDADEDDRRNGSFRDSEKPVQRLVDPTFVPKSRAFFDHDDRGGDDAKWRGRTAYDPRIDFGPRRDRGRFSWGSRDDRRDRKYDGDRRRDDRRSFSERKSFSDKGFGDRSFERSRADGTWAHDKFVELEDDGGSKKEGVEVFVDQSKSSSRKVESD